MKSLFNNINNTLLKSKSTGYGDSSEFLTKWSNSIKIVLGIEVKETELCIIMILLKLIRESGKHNFDSRLDILGYTTMLDKFISGGYPVEPS
jgi:hypothetical protein